jgi:hypothetical protein
MMADHVNSTDLGWLSISPAFQGHHTNQARHKPGVISPEYRA